jgi:phage terminase large subunit-like protein
VADDLFEGITLLTPERIGRLSQLERLALALGPRVGQFGELLELTDAEALALLYEPGFSLRPIQVTPRESFVTWFFLGGRGAGKTHAGAAAVIEEALLDAEARILIVGPTYSEIVKNQLEGPSGILTLCPPWFAPRYLKARRKLIFPNGAQATWLPAKSADKFRGHASSMVWADEIVAWKVQPIEVLDECYRVNRHATGRMRRLGLPPRVLITTTPKPTPLFRHLLTMYREGMVLARSSTFDNAQNLASSYINLARRLADTVEGRREYRGELTFDMDPSLFRGVDWDASRVDPDQRPERFDLLVVAVDPATGEKVGAHGADNHGIVVVGFKLDAEGLLHAYVLADLSHQSPEPSSWAKKAVAALRAWEGAAERAWIFAETNTGGSMVKSTIRTVDGTVKVKTQRAKNSKAERAAPVSAMAEAGLVHMVGKHHELEGQLERFTGADGGHQRDDRVDAMVWPIWRYVVRRNKNKGALAEVEAEDEQAEAA